MMASRTWCVFGLACLLSTMMMTLTTATHHKCVDITQQNGEESNAFYNREAAYCTACYMETLMGLKKEKGQDLVLGGNDGISYDPAWYFEYFQNVPNHRVHWVEPIPELYRRLNINTGNITDRRLLNMAVKPSEGSADRLDFVCWDLDMVDKFLLDGANPFPEELAKPKEYWKTLCSTEKSALIEASNVYGTKARAASSDRLAELETIVEKYLVTHNVPALTPRDIMLKNNMTNILYLQIDLEGLDNIIVESLPLDIIKPKLILFENHNGFAVKPMLESHGYHVCCCLKQWGSNIVAVLKDDAQLKISGLDNTN